jgi:hypothetical protein
MKIISGGQTGADRAALDVAIALEFDYGGAIPSSRRTEDGTLPERYDKMTELKTRSYPMRTEKNVADSDATIIFTSKKIGAGSALTIKFAEKHRKPYLHINLSKMTDEEAAEALRVWLREVTPAVLNVAGSRKSSAPGIYGRVYRILKEVFMKWCYDFANIC